MKIAIFEPHPDDLLFGPGPLILKWINEDHEIHIITVTDGRACYRKMKDSLDNEAKKMTEDEVASMRIEEAKKAVEFIGLPQENLHLLYFHDADGQKYVEKAIPLVRPLIQGVDRIVLPSDNNAHVDHQATHDIAVKAAQELNLNDIEFLVYFIPSYGKFQEDSIKNQFEISIKENLRKKLLNWLKIYQSQKKLKFTWKMYNRFLEKIDTRRFGKFSFEEIGKYYNF
ncbi:MAG: hypothetical protein GF317_01535 [Candidatus Lokiarchaeota archaeon]|nr:hypothetical protein [Candidatus Lokiarchaeota archaeon]MBD3198626.1 hypothetical protein [Candidatus Lokiarchaeota archaeon]